MRADALEHEELIGARHPLRQHEELAVTEDGAASFSAIRAARLALCAFAVQGVSVTTILDASIVRAAFPATCYRHRTRGEVQIDARRRASAW